MLFKMKKYVFNNSKNKIHFNGNNLGNEPSFFALTIISGSHWTISERQLIKDTVNLGERVSWIMIQLYSNQRTIHYTSLAKPWYGCKIGLRNDFNACF